MSGPDATEAAAGTATDEDELPTLAAVRPRATTAGGDPAVEIRFGNGARIRYRATDAGIEEAWIPPGSDEPARSHAADLPSADGGSGESGTGAPARSELSDRALCTVASYLSFDGRRRAAFSWGDANVSVLLGEDPASEGG
jgi:hypothetical protein